MRNLVLFGFMGTGKTAAGRELARRLRMKFIDMDDVIEKQEACTISEIFAEKGESHFRDVESQVAAALSRRQGLVIATGGGVVLNRKNVDALQGSGTGICLTASPEAIYERVKHQSHRPLLMFDDPLQRIKTLLHNRAPFYATVKYHIDTSDLPMESVVNKILDIVNADRGPRAATPSPSESSPNPEYP